MKVYDRQTKEYREIRQYGQEKLQFLYENPFGRILLKLVISPVTSRIYGWYQKQPFTAAQIPEFIREHDIRMEDFEEREYRSFSDFFTRKLKPGARQADLSDMALISPADAKLLVYDVDEGLKIRVKGSDYTLEELLGTAAGGRIDPKAFHGGECLVFRLCMDDYHRYCFVDDGKLLCRYHIRGKLHTVSSISKDYKIYKENSRVVNLYDTVHFGRMIQIEVGALLVGRIRNRKVRAFRKAEEKGFFEPGGSTIIVMLQKDRAELDRDILQMSAQGIETIVRYGEKIGEKHVSTTADLF